MTDEQHHVQSNDCNKKERAHGLVLYTRTLRCRFPIKIGRESKFDAQLRSKETITLQPIMDPSQNLPEAADPAASEASLWKSMKTFPAAMPAGHTTSVYPMADFSPVAIFCDECGLSPTNTTCLCGTPSRRQMNRQSHRVPGGVHYICSRGRCRFYVGEKDKNGGQLQIYMGSREIFIQKCYI